MKSVILIEYPKCSTCQKAKKWLEEKGISFSDRDIVTETPSEKELAAWWKAGDLPIKKLWNTSGMKYREQKLSEKLPKMGEKEQLLLLASDGMLLKRPMVVLDDKLVLTGFREADWESTFEQNQ